MHQILLVSRFFKLLALLTCAVRVLLLACLVAPLSTAGMESVPEASRTVLHWSLLLLLARRLPCTTAALGK
jgi:hypothetical protein